MKLICALLLVLCIAPSCKKLGICQDVALQLDREDHNGAELKMNGFYYGNPDTSKDGVVRYETIVFFRNGVIALPGRPDPGQELDYIIGAANTNVLTKTRFDWGLFKTSGSNISIAGWKKTKCGYPAILRTGYIQNDTTFMITKTATKGKYGSAEQGVNQVFHFRYCPVLPDSTNEFVD